MSMTCLTPTSRLQRGACRGRPSPWTRTRSAARRSARPPRRPPAGRRSRPAPTTFSCFRTSPASWEFRTTSSRRSRPLWRPCRTTSARRPRSTGQRWCSTRPGAGGRARLRTAAGRSSTRSTQPTPRCRARSRPATLPTKRSWRGPAPASASRAWARRTPSSGCARPRRGRPRQTPQRFFSGSTMMTAATRRRWGSTSQPPSSSLSSAGSPQPRSPRRPRQAGCHGACSRRTPQSSASARGCSRARSRRRRWLGSGSACTS
mmetsp:Transcript_28043/g.80871  ORF Transcript_28043/g.80871 Transcript_28043/m.80871 type:complete len:261 (+) Transcript_28043:202-984(+)